MSWLWIFTIILAILTVISIVIASITFHCGNDGAGSIFRHIAWAVASVLVAFAIFSVEVSIRIKKELVRQEKEREQILYQVENLTEDKDKIKLNEWILTYNDWVNDVNTSKETWGWFSIYYYTDMSEHTIIDLV